MNWVAAIINLAVLLQTLEMFWVRQHLKAQDPWAVVFPKFLENVYPIILFLRLSASLAAFLVPSPWFFAILLLSTWFLAIRFRGSFNGGSDAMTFHVLGAVTLTKFYPELEIWAMAYVAVHACVSYFVAGLSKAKEPDWWTGQALAIFLNESNAAGPKARGFGRRWGQGSVLYRWPALVGMFFDLFFPLCLLTPKALPVFLPLGVLFHLSNFYFFGLNRFFFAWVATYPAIYLFSHHLHSH